MGINLQGLYNQTHQFSAGIVNIDAPFVGNVLAIELTTKPEYVPNSQIIGYLYQHYQTASKGYALRSGKDIVSLELPETESLDFVPTPYLSDSYTLSIKYATIGAVIDGENTIGLPQQILDLPNNVQAIDLQIEQIETQIQEIEESIPTWDTLTAKPQTFPPSTHNHTKNQITDLSLDWTEITGKPATFAPSSHTHTVEQITGLSVAKESVLLSQNSTLESKKSYLATVNNLVCSLPANPAIGDWIEIANGNFSSFRVNHGNTSQAILNNQTATTTGSIDSGVILKPYGYINLVFVGSNLWVSFGKYRTVNNWLNPTLVDSQVNYTATGFESYSYSSWSDFTNTAPFNINDGNLKPVYKLGNGTFGLMGIVCTFPQAVALKSFTATRLNNNFGQAEAMPQTVEIHQGNTRTNQIYSGAFAHNTLINVNHQATSTQYLFCFLRNANEIAVSELVINTQTMQGGEISVV